MFALTHTGEGLLFIHCILLLGFVVGSLVLPWEAAPRDAPRAEHLARTVITVATGLSAIGFTLFILGVTFLFTPTGIALALALLVAVSLAARGRVGLHSSFWSSRARAFAASWDVPAMLIYLLMIGMSVPAVLPNLGSDPVSYHLAYAVDWAQAHGITTDPYLRLPFYANNFLLLFAAAIAFKATELVNFLVWGMSLLTALGSFAAIRIAQTRAERAALASWIAFALVAAVVLNPTYLRWNDTAYIDVPIACFALTTVLALHLAVRTREPRWLIAGTLVGAFLIGMKVSLLVLAPLVALEIAVAARFMEVPRRTLFALLALLIVCCSPWYLRNFLSTGDPIPPTLNLALRGDDSIITRFEWKQIQRDFHQVPATPKALLALPFRAFVDPQNIAFREYGTTLLILFLYAPFLWLLSLIATRNRDGEGMLYALGVAGFTCYWIGSATLLRYGLLLFPLLATAIGILAVRLANRFPTKTAWSVPALCLLLAIPSPGSQQTFREFFLDHTRNMLTSYRGDEKSYLLLFGSDYAAEQRVVQEWHKRGLHGDVYVLISQSGAYYRLDGVRNIGDWIGPAGIFRLQRAVMIGCGAEFIARLNAGGIVILPEKKFPPQIDGMLIEQLRAAKYEAVPMPDATRFFIRPDGTARYLPARECDRDPNWFIPAASGD
jgi:hypothetical protein